MPIPAEMKIHTRSGDGLRKNRSRNPSFCPTRMIRTPRATPGPTLGSPRTSWPSTASSLRC